MVGNSTIFLIGFMGCGKTTFGKKLATKLNLQFVDLDEEVLRLTSSPSLKSLIEEKEIRFFREAESKTLKSLSVDGCVVATGGGTSCYLDNLAYMKGRGVVVYLNVDEGVLFSRLKNTDLDERPLLQNLDADGLRNFIHEKLQERVPVYEQANIIFNPVTQKIEELAELLTQ